MTLKDIQKEVGEWLQKVGLDSSPRERALRLCEEAFELAQSVEVDRRQLHALVDYVFNRPVGHTPQEIAGTFLTLAAFANSVGESLEELAVEELKRINTPERIEKWKAGVSFIIDIPEET